MKRQELLAIGIATAGVVVATALVTGSAFQASRQSTATFVANGIRFTVQPGYERILSRDPLIVVVRLLPNANSGSLMKVYFETRDSATPGSNLTPEKVEEYGLTKTAERPAMLAGRKGGCVEYSVRSQRGVPIAQAECSFGTDLHTSFFGTPQRVNDFYAFMASAQHIDGGH